MSQKTLKKWANVHHLAVSAVAVSTLVLLLYMSRLTLAGSFINFPYHKLESGMRDWIYQLGDSAPRDPRICFLWDDAASHKLDHLWDDEIEASPVLKKMKQSGETAGVWPREVFAAILERLAEAGALAVGFDYVFQDKRPESDPVFKAALDKYASKVVVGSQLDAKGTAGQRVWALNPPSTSLIPDLRDSRVGFVNVFSDPDGVVRRFQMRMTLEEKAGLPVHADSAVFPSLPVRLLETAGFEQLIPKGRDFHLVRFTYKGETREESLRPESVANIFVPSYWESNYQNGEFFRNKLVLVGPTGNLFKDVGNSPFGIIGGPEFHLNVMNAVLTGSFLHESPFWLDLLLIFSGGLTAYLAGRVIRNPVARAVGVLALAGGFFLLALWLYNSSDLVIPVFSPTLALAGSTGVALVWQQLMERREKSQMRKTFERYVSRDVVKELLDNPASYLNTIGGARKTITVLFSDVRGFTSITESGDAQALVEQLNQYFDHMVNLVFANRGTLDKFIGDAVMAHWGGISSVGEKEDTINAVRTAVQMLTSLQELNRQWTAENKMPLKIGIGLNQGEAIVGNLGAEVKKEITAIGDAVNTASRFEGMTKEFRVDLLMGESVARFAREHFHVRTVALTLPKGKTVPVEVFTVVGDRAQSENPPEWLPIYEQGVKLYRTREFGQAAECFAQVKAALPDDPLATEYLRLCRDYEVNPPPPDWNAVFVMTSK